MVVHLAGPKYRQDRPIIDYFRNATERISSLPGVSAAGVVNYLPLYGGLGCSTGFSIAGRPDLPPGEGPSTNVRVGDAGYFGAMHIPLLRGRVFNDVEDSEAKHVAIISESLAEQYFPGEESIGKIISVDMFDKPNPTKIIGIVGDVRYDSLINQA